MIQSIWVKNQNGDYLELPLRTSGEAYGIYVFNLDGLGSPKATVNGVGGPGFDGVRVNSIRTDARHLVLSLAMPNPATEEAAKALIYKMFPIKQNITLGITTDSVEVKTECFVESNEVSQFSKIENATISLICPNPYFMDLVEWESSLSYDSGIPLFEFPFSNESLTDPLIEFGLVTTVPTAQILYDGAVETGAIFSLFFTGNVGGLSISNSNGGQIMTIDETVGEALAGSDIMTGDTIRINTRSGEKSVEFIRGGNTYNMIAGIGLDDDWITIRPGINYIVIGATTGVQYIEADIRFNPLREGA